MIKIKLIIPVWPDFKRAAQSCLIESIKQLEQANKGKFDIPISVCTHSLLSSARNSGVDKTTSAKKQRSITDCDYCLFVDADTGFTFENIVALFDLQVPVVGGGYRYRFGETKDHFVAGYWQKGFPGLNESCVAKNETGIITVDWSGGGFLLVRSDVFSKIEYPWFRYGVIEQGETAFEYSEDMGFCIQLKKNNIPLLCHCGLNLIHRQD